MNIPIGIAGDHTAHSSSNRMFMHADESRQKEAERLVCCGCRHGLLRLDPEVDASTIQLVGYQTTLEEIGDLFHQV